MANEPIKLVASVDKISTCASGGYKIVLEAPDTEMVNVMSLFPGVRKVVFRLEMSPLDK